LSGTSTPMLRYFESSTTLAYSAAPRPTPTPTELRAPPASPVEVAGAIVAIALALAAGILGYRVIRGGRGL
jgi:hypothetical protein